MPSKTKADLVAELVGEDIAISDGAGNLELNFMPVERIEIDDCFAYLRLNDNPNTPEALEKALRVLNGEVLAVEMTKADILNKISHVELINESGDSNARTVYLEFEWCGARTVIDWRYGSVEISIDEDSPLAIDEMDGWLKACEYLYVKHSGAAQ